MRISLGSGERRFSESALVSEYTKDQTSGKCLIVDNAQRIPHE
jgi:hypothetical protein